MFDWLPNLYWDVTTSIWTAYVVGIGVGFLLGILVWQRHVAAQEGKRLAADIEARMLSYEREYEELETDHDAVAWKLLEDCEFL